MVCDVVQEKEKRQKEAELRRLKNLKRQEVGRLCVYLGVCGIIMSLSAPAGRSFVGCAASRRGWDGGPGHVSVGRRLGS